MMDAAARVWRRVCFARFRWCVIGLGDGVWQCGGYDTQGRPASPDVTDDEIIAEVDRCVAEYGRFGRAYAFFGFFLGGMADPAIARKYGVMLGHYAQVCGMPLA